MARQSQPVSNQWNFPVKMVKLFTPAGKETNVHAIQREDTGDVFDRTFTDKYGIIQNKDLIDLTEAGFASVGLNNYNRSIRTAQGGARLYATYDFKSSVKKLAKVGDPIGFRLQVQNSFDGTMMAGFVSGALCLVCTNGMSRLSSQIELQKKHFVSLTMDTIQLGLQKAIAMFDNSLVEYDKMTTINVSNEEGSRLLKRLTDNSTITEKVREAIEGRWLTPKVSDNNTARSLWGVYNSVTAELRDLQGDRFEYSERLGGRLGSVFSEMTNNPVNLAEMLS